MLLLLVATAKAELNLYSRELIFLSHFSLAMISHILPAILSFLYERKHSHSKRTSDENVDSVTLFSSKPSILPTLLGTMLQFAMRMVFIASGLFLASTYQPSKWPTVRSDRRPHGYQHYDVAGCYLWTRRHAMGGWNLQTGARVYGRLS